MAVLPTQYIVQYSRGGLKEQTRHHRGHIITQIIFAIEGPSSCIVCLLVKAVIDRPVCCNILTVTCEHGRVCEGVHKAGCLIMP